MTIDQFTRGSFPADLLVFGKLVKKQKKKKIDETNSLLYIMFLLLYPLISNECFMEASINA